MSDKDKKDNLIDELKKKTQDLKQDIYVHEKLHEKLLNVNREWEQTFDAIPDMIAVIDRQFRIIRANKRLCENVGIKREEVIGELCYRVLHGADSPPGYCPHHKALAERKEQFAEVFEKKLNGYFVLSSTPINDDSGECVGTVEIGRDITGLKSAEEDIRRKEALTKAISDSSMDAIIVIDGKGIITYFNHAAERIFQYSAEEAIGKALHDFLVSSKARVEYYKRLPNFENTGQCVVVGKTLDVFGTRKDGTRFPVEISISSFQLNGVWHSAGTIRDITERKKMEKKLLTASITDELTGLLNRRGFFTFAEKQFELAKRNMRNFSVLFLDLNNLKEINDTFGHTTGDQALMDTAAILRQTFRASDVIARMGGDEFVVILIEPRKVDIEKIVSVHIKENLAMHNEKTRAGYALSISMGFAHFDPEHPSTTDQLLAQADAAMYADKQRQKLERE
ncbi:MAG: diguanylate cyclase [Nitrospiraceae bacterium]|nr:MAG: diguanylate cyclase [Nitrospiraceae bacterium]